MKNKLRVFLVVLLSAVLFIAGCNESGSGELNEEEVDGEVQISFGGSAPGGVFYYMVGIMSNLLTDQVEDANVTNVSTGAAVENVLSVARGDLHFGLTYGALINEAWEGRGIFEDESEIGQNIRGVAKAYESPHYFVAIEGSGIETIQDLEGKTVAMGAPGSGAQYNSSQIFEALNLEVDEERLAFSDAKDALIEGRVDALGQSGAPSGAVDELAETEDIIIIPFSDEEMETLTNEVPFYETGQLSKDTYTGMENDVQMPYFTVYWIAHQDVSDELMEQIVEVALDEANRQQLIDGHPLWAEMEEDIEGFEEYGPPIHPGVMNYFER